MRNDDSVQPQLEPKKFGYIVNLFKPVLHEYAAIERSNTHSPLEKYQAQLALFDQFINQLQSTYESDLIIAFLSEHWEKFINDLEANAVLEQLEIDEAQESNRPEPPHLVEHFTDELILLFGVHSKSELPKSGSDFVQALHDRHEALKKLQTKATLKDAWLALFKSKDLSALDFDELLTMIESLDLIIKQGDPQFNQAVQAFFGKENLSQLNSKVIIDYLKKKTNFKPVQTPKHLLILREILEWNQIFIALQRGQNPNEARLKKLIQHWPDLIADLLASSLEPYSTVPKTSSRFFKSIKKVFNVREIPMTQDELVKMLYHRIMLVEPEEVRHLLEENLERATS